MHRFFGYAVALSSAKDDEFYVRQMVAADNNVCNLSSVVFTGEIGAKYDI